MEGGALLYIHGKLYQEDLDNHRIHALGTPEEVDGQVVFGVRHDVIKKLKVRAGLPVDRSPEPSEYQPKPGERNEEGRMQNRGERRADRKAFRKGGSAR